MNNLHIIQSVTDANAHKSKLTPEIANILPGYSSPKIRHCLNNICSIPNINYLEIGSWYGSTFISALYNNQINAIGIDNWSQFGGPQKQFEENCKKYLQNNQYKFINGDCFKVDLSILPNIDVYFYDGYHSEELQEKAFIYFNPILKNKFIAIVDDWNWDFVRNGTLKAFQKLNYKIEYKIEFLGTLNDFSQWWNGFYIAIINK